MTGISMEQVNACSVCFLFMLLSSVYSNYSRKLLREITKIEEALMNDDKLLALTLIRELKEDTEKDVEA